MDTKRELIHIGTLSAQIEDTDFRIGDTTVKARFGIWLTRDGVSVTEDMETDRLNRRARMTGAISDFVLGLCCVGC